MRKFSTFLVLLLLLCSALIISGLNNIAFNVNKHILNLEAKNDMKYPLDDKHYITIRLIQLAISMIIVSTNTIFKLAFNYLTTFELHSTETGR